MHNLSEKGAMKLIRRFIDYLLLFTVAACIGIFGYVYLKNPDAPAKPLEKLSAEMLVDKYMKDTQLDLIRQEKESVYRIKSIKEHVKPSKTVKQEISPLDIPIEKQIAKDYSVIDQQSLTESIDQKLYESQVEQLQNEKAKHEYAKEFIANARRHGYHITLSEDLQVTSVRPIRKPTNQSADEDTFESEPAN
jgi:hypothetical protein